MDESRPLDSIEKLDWLRLIRSENVGPITFNQLLGRFGDASAALEALPELARRGGLRRSIRICAKSAAEKEVAALHKLGGQMIASCEPGYPAPLAQLNDAPPLISVLGHALLLERPAVAVLGARNGSANGIRFTETLAREVAEGGYVIASGLARGIDAAAHRGALDGGTVAVMAGGVDVIYPKENRPLYDEIVDRGAIISEMRLGLQPQARHFPNRNRIVSGLAAAVVVVEATLRSGSLITARLAGEQGREVLAVPGNPLDPRARGTNKLIREGAQLIEGADDVLEALSTSLGRLSQRPESPGFRPEPPPSKVDEDTLARSREEVLALLGPDPVSVDQLLRMSGIPAALLALVLLELELAGRLERSPGGQVSLAFA